MPEKMEAETDHGRTKPCSKKGREKMVWEHQFDEKDELKSPLYFAVATFGDIDGIIDDEPVYREETSFEYYEVTSLADVNEISANYGLDFQINLGNPDYPPVWWAVGYCKQVVRDVLQIVAMLLNIEMCYIACVRDGSAGLNQVKKVFRRMQKSLPSELDDKCPE